MAKILLVEDDKSLREIYGVRLQAEGYEIVSAGDGEEALAFAIKERPDLIVSDVMMPKISGFDMLDILRSTTETKDIKVIMMTALSSEDQRARGEALGADRYLVKSQVGIEDVVRTVHDVLGDGVPGAAPAASPTATPTPPAPAPVDPTPALDLSTPPLVEDPATIPEPTAPIVPDPTPTISLNGPAPAVPSPSIDDLSPLPDPTPTPTDPPVINLPPTPAPADPAPVRDLSDVLPVGYTPSVPTVEPLSTPEPVVTPVAPAPVAPTPLPEPTAPFSSPRPASLGDRVINPISPMENTLAPLDIAAQMNQELAATLPPAPVAPLPTPPVPPVQPELPPLPPQPPVTSVPPAPTPTV